MGVIFFRLLKIKQLKQSTSEVLLNDFQLQAINIWKKNIRKKQSIQSLFRPNKNYSKHILGISDQSKIGEKHGYIQ